MAVLKTTSPTEQPSEPMATPLKTVPSSNTNNADLVKHVTSNVQNGMSPKDSSRCKKTKLGQFYEIMRFGSLTIFRVDANHWIVKNEFLGRAACFMAPG